MSIKKFEAGKWYKSGNIVAMCAGEDLNGIYSFESTGLKHYIFLTPLGWKEIPNPFAPIPKTTATDEPYVPDLFEQDDDSVIDSARKRIVGEKKGKRIKVDIPQEELNRPALESPPFPNLNEDGWANISHRRYQEDVMLIAAGLCGGGKFGHEEDIAKWAIQIVDAIYAEQERKEK